MKFNLLILLLLIITLGCSTQTKDQKQIFRYNESKNITSLDPAFAKYKANIWVVNQLFNGLVQINDDLEMDPAIAMRWDISDDGSIYTFYLRDDIYFHDDALFEGGKGRRVVADDFVYSFDRIIDEAVASPGAWIFNDRVDPDSPFVALSDDVLVVKLIRPFRPFLGILSMQYCSVVPREVVDHYKKDFRSHPVGTGPFKLKVWKEGDVMFLVRNENYFEKEQGRGLPYLDGVKITFMQEKNMEFFKLHQNELDFVSGIDGKTVKDDIITPDGALLPELSEKLRLQKSPYLNTEYIGLLVDPELAEGSPLLLKKVRQAISHSIDRDKMIAFLRNNLGIPAYSGFVPPGLPSFDNDRSMGYKYDPEKAMQLLNEAGYKDGSFPELSLFTTSSNTDICTFVQDQLNNVGIKTMVEIVQPGTLLEMTSNSKAPFFRASWIADYPDEESFLVVFYGKNPAPPNYTRFNNPGFDRLYEKALAENNDSIRYQLYRDMGKIVMEEAPVVLLYYDQVLNFIQKNVVGLENNPLNLLDLRRVRFTN